MLSICSRSFRFVGLAQAAAVAGRPTGQGLAAAADWLPVTGHGARGAGGCGGPAARAGPGTFWIRVLTVTVAGGP